MIFQHTISAVLSGTKTQTRRVRYLGDRLGLIDGGPRRQENDPAWVIEFKLVSSSPSGPACLSPTGTRGFETSGAGGAR